MQPNKKVNKIMLNQTWQTLSTLTVEAGGVWGVLNVTFSTDPIVAEGVIRASLHWFALVALASLASLTVVIGDAPWNNGFVLRTKSGVTYQACTDSQSCHSSCM